MESAASAIDPPTTNAAASPSIGARENQDEEPNSEVALNPTLSIWIQALDYHASLAPHAYVSRLSVETTAHILLFQANDHPLQEKVLQIVLRILKHTIDVLRTVNNNEADELERLKQEVETCITNMSTS